MVALEQRNQSCSEMIFYALILLTVSEKITVFTEYGLVIEELEPSKLVITHGTKIFNFDIHMRYPSYQISQDEKCVARELYNMENKSFDGIIETVNKDFHKIIEEDIQEIKHDTISTTLFKAVSSPSDLQKMMVNLQLCQSELKCLMDPVNTHRQPGSRGYTRYKNQPYPCYPEQAMRTEQCSRVRPNAVCCYKQNSKNGGNCPMDALEKPINRLQYYLDNNPSVIVYFKGKDVPIKTIDQFCFVLNKATTPNGTILYQNYTNAYTDPVGTDPHWDYKRFLEQSHREKRANKDLWYRVKNQHAVDLSLEHVDILNSTISELKNALEHPENKVSSMYGDKEHLKDAKQWICNFLGAYKTENIVNNLYEVRSKLEAELERLDFECKTNSVPNLIPTEILMRFCKVTSDNTICIKEQIRELFKCETVGSNVQNDEIIYRVKLKISVPIGDQFLAHKLFTIPKYISSDTFIDHRNVSNLATTSEPKTENSDILKLKDILLEIGNPRYTRSMVDLHHNIMLNNIPDYAAQHSSDVLFFKNEVCQKYSEIIVCPYSKNDHHTSKCTVALMTGNTKTVESICEFSIYTTESNCEQLKTSNGYIISTAEQVHITQMSDQKSVFIDEILTSCSSVCFVPREEEGSSFQCDGRNYFLEPTNKNNSIVLKQTEPIDLLKINDGRARLSDTIKTDFGKFNSFLKDKNVDQRVLNLLTLTSGGVLGMAAFLFGTRRAVLGGQLLAAFIQKLRKKVHERSKMKNIGHQTYLKLKQLQSESTMCA